MYGSKFVNAAKVLISNTVHPYIKLLDFVDFAVQAAKSGIGPFASQILNLTQSIDKKK